MTRRVGSGPARRFLPGVFLVALLAAGGVGWAVWSFSFDRAARALAAETEAQLRFTAESLETSLSRYKLLAKALSRTAAVRRRATQDLPGGEAAVETLLLQMTGVSGAAEIRFATPATAQGPAEQAAVRRAFEGAMGFAFSREDGGAFVVAAPVWDGREVAGAIAVRQLASQLEFAWRALPKVIFFAGPGGEVRLASLAELRLRTLYAAAAPIPEREAWRRGGLDFWRLTDPAWAALGVVFDHAIIETAPVLSLDMTAFALADAAPARRAALLAAAASGALVFALALAAAIVLQRRAALAARLAIEERANAELELKVADRTVELTAEIEERRAVTRRLRDAQEELVQAAKLAALGRMAAGIAHEINQPLAAIRNFAENAGVLMDRGRGEEARANLGRISDLTDRAAQIIRNLRAFARNEQATAASVSLEDAVEGALTIVSARMREAGAELRWRPPETPAYVVGGLVRLQQVIVNLIANALDAQEGAARPLVEIAVETGRGTARLSVRDAGTGLAEEVRAKLFEPFYSTKDGAGGRGGGLGLGLAISYGIVRSFGGELRAANHSEGGAVFTVELRLGEAPRAAA